MKMLELAVGIAGLIGVPAALGVTVLLTRHSMGRAGYRIHGAAKRMLLSVAGSIDPMYYRPLVKAPTPYEARIKAIIQDIASDVGSAPGGADYSVSGETAKAPALWAKRRALNEPDHYRVLDVSPAAPQSEIRAAYRRLYAATRPDRGGNEADFRKVIAAGQTLLDHDLRRKYDQRRFGRRFASRLYDMQTRSPARGEVRGWSVDASTSGSGPELPWYAYLRIGRARSRPAIEVELAALVVIVLAWATAAIGFGAAAASSAESAVTTAYSLLAMMAWVLFVVGHILRERRIADESSESLPNALIAIAVLVAAVAIWAGGLGQLVGWLFAMSALMGVLVTWSVHRVRRAAQLHKSIGVSVRQFNAFGPVGVRPKADRPTGKVLREILTNLPAARLFVELPFGTGRVPFAILCGNRLALLCAPVARQVGDADTESLAYALARLREELPNAEIRGWILWPVVPERDAKIGQAEYEEIAIDGAAGGIGSWLAEGGNYFDLDLLRAVRMRLATASSKAYNLATMFISARRR